MSIKGIYDIHCHIVPGVDDGATDIGETVKLLRMEYEQGVRTVILWMNPLSNIMGGWGIWETVNGEQKLTTECIENVLMMVPFSAVVMWTFHGKAGNGWNNILWLSGKIAFGFSLMIEILQLLLRLGTFQLSDIFYNTVGGVLGGMCYWGIIKIKKGL